MFTAKKFLSIKIVSLIISSAVFLIFTALAGEVKAISISSGPTASSLTTTTANISWQTNEIGNSQVYYTDNGNPGWITSKVESSTFSFLSVDGLSRKNLWALGIGDGVSKIYHYDGASWVLQYSTAAITLHSIAVIDSTHAWAVGSGGNILFYNGSSWSLQATLGGYLNKVYALDSSHVWAVGDNAADQGALFFFDGSAWSVKATYSETLKSLWVSDATHIWAITQLGEILFYNGSSMVSQASYSYALYDIDGYDSSHVWVVGQGGYIVFFNGTSWQLQSTASGVLFAVHVVGPGSVWAVGGTQAYHTENGGANWSAVSPPVGSMYAVFHFSANQVWVGSYLGNIHYYGLNYNYSYYTAPEVTNHQMTLSSLAPSTTYYYYVCSASSGQEVCSNDYSFTTLGVCPDGTYAGLCSGTRYCDPVLLTLVDNCIQCSYVCPSATPYCNTANGQCLAGCNLTTPVGSCYNTQYCASANTFVNDCRQCGYTCPSGTPYCNTANGQCLAGCNLTTPVGGCSGTQYCQSANNLVNNCLQCGYTCPSGTNFCNNGTCEAWCATDISVGECRGDQMCTSSLAFENWCNYCGYYCPATEYCDGTTHQCDNTKCSDGTARGTCNTNQQYCCGDTDTFCTPGTLTNKCTKCGYTCSSSEPYCNANFDCEPSCPDGTPFGQCNTATKWYCADGAYYPADGPNCYVCDFDCSLTPGTPYCDEDETQACINRCSDGTEASQCSNTSTKYCNDSYQLVDDCRQSCGYTCSGATPQCNDLTGVCEADTTPPVINNINVVPDINSAVLTFDTSEPTQAFILLNSTPSCDGDVTAIGLLGFASSRTIEFSDYAGQLAPLTTYYFCITVYDAAFNYAATTEPSPWFFTTLAAPDTTPPTVDIIAPQEGENISTPTYTITVQASDDNSVSYLDLGFDGAVDDFSFAHLTTAPYEYDFDVSLYSTGEHTLRARATDGAGNSALAERHFTISFDAKPPVIDNISDQVQIGANDIPYAVITWRTNEPATSRVDFTLENLDGTYDGTYGGDTNCASLTDCVKDDTLVTDGHSITLPNLEKNRRYHYQITSCDSNNYCSH